jgi:lauroyl/myristoyl acyltransferase
LGSEKWIHVRYEDLVTNPNQEMQRLCAFINVPFDEAVLHPYEGDHDTKALPDRRATGGDNNFNKHSEIDATKGEEWRFMQLPHHLGGIARSVAAELGYNLPQEQTAGYPVLTKPQSLARSADRKRRIHSGIYERHQKYDHPQQSHSGTFVRLIRRCLRKTEDSITYERGLQVINFIARRQVIQHLYHKHLNPAWRVLEIVTGEHFTQSLKNTWTANYFNFMLDWVLLKRQALKIKNGLLSTDGLAHLKNALSLGKGVIVVGHHCQPLRLWGDFVRFTVRTLGVSQTQAIGGLRELLPDSSLMEQGRSQAEQNILVKQLENCLTVLSVGGIIYIDADGAQGSDKPTQLPCLSRQVPFMTGFAELTLQTGAPVVPVTAVYTTSGQVRLQYHPPLIIPNPSLSHDQRIRELLMQYVAILEAQWRKHPENIPLHICRKILSCDGTQ